MKTDALDRRLRFAPPNPAVERVIPQESDVIIFEALHRHGPLPIHYLYEYTKHLRPSYQRLQRRLTDFYNGDAAGPYLIRPPRQFDAFEARYQHIVYDLAPRAKVVLVERERLGTFPPERRDPFLHQLMQACVAASIELLSRVKGLRYISREEILTKAGNPIALPITELGVTIKLVPDDLFGFEYQMEDGRPGYRFFAVEIDRNTESIERKNPEYSAFGRKVRNYLRVIRDHLHKEWWGVPNLSVLTVTTNSTHARNILDYIERQNEVRLGSRFAFAVESSFGAHWRVPKGLLTGLLDEPWLTVNGTKDITVP